MSASTPLPRGPQRSVQGEADVQDKPEPVLERKGAFWGTVAAVGAAFVGLRRGKDLERDGARLNPLHVIAVGFVGVLLFVLSLIVLVNWVVAK